MAHYLRILIKLFHGLTKITNRVIFSGLLSKKGVKMNKKPQLVYLNPQTSRVIKITFTLPRLFGLFLVIFLVALLVARILLGESIEWQKSKTIAELKSQNALLEKKLASMETKISDVQRYVASIEQIDDQLRALVDLPPLSEDVRKVGIGGASVDLADEPELQNHPLAPKVINNAQLLNKLEREVKLEKTSFNQLLTNLERKKDSLKYLPVLKPVPQAYISSRFGNRRHPILGKIHFHRGVDLVAYRGAPVIAPADGYVTFAGRNGGYGNFISINHKYGYETHYGHLSRILVRPGQFVHRGDKIAEVGSTGLSTNPHLHYEVVFKGKPQDPIGYFLNDVNYF